MSILEYLNVNYKYLYTLILQKFNILSKLADFIDIYNKYHNIIVTINDNTYPLMQIQHLLNLDSQLAIFIKQSKSVYKNLKTINSIIIQLPQENSFETIFDYHESNCNTLINKFISKPKNPKNNTLNILSVSNTLILKLYNSIYNNEEVKNIIKLNPIKIFDEIDTNIIINLCENILLTSKEFNRNYTEFELFCIQNFLKTLSSKYSLIKSSLHKKLLKFAHKTKTDPDDEILQEDANIENIEIQEFVPSIKTDNKPTDEEPINEETDE